MKKLLLRLSLGLGCWLVGWQTPAFAQSPCGCLDGSANGGCIIGTSDPCPPCDNNDTRCGNNPLAEVPINQADSTLLILGLAYGAWFVYRRVRKAMPARG
jgi:hypothetical protein